jgi:hypothetical protein
MNAVKRAPADESQRHRLGERQPVTPAMPLRFASCSETGRLWIDYSAPTLDAAEKQLQKCLPTITAA